MTSGYHEFSASHKEAATNAAKVYGDLLPLSQDDERHCCESIASVIHIEDGTEHGTGSLRYSAKLKLLYTETAGHCLSKYSNKHKRPVIRKGLVGYLKRYGVNSYQEKFDLVHAVVHPKFNGHEGSGWDFGVAVLRSTGEKGQTPEWLRKFPQNCKCDRQDQPGPVDPY